MKGKKKSKRSERKRNVAAYERARRSRAFYRMRKAEDKAPRDGAEDLSAWRGWEVALPVVAASALLGWIVAKIM